MTLDNLQNWILSEAGLDEELDLLSRFAAAKSVGLQMLEEDLAVHTPDWRRLLFASSILTKPRDAASTEAALMVAHTGLLYSGKPIVIEASATLLAQLANHLAMHLAEERELLRGGIKHRLGISERMLFARREMAQSLFLSVTIKANHFSGSCRTILNALRGYLLLHHPLQVRPIWFCDGC